MLVYFIEILGKREFLTKKQYRFLLSTLISLYLYEKKQHNEQIFKDNFPQNLRYVTFFYSSPRNVW